ncbi:MAG TPA: ABC transporter permease [Longimicrobiales bacterium]|nr:ABC transporter permease [Longimicrobiales bacterium]
MADLKLALRALARTPFITGVAVFSLALGIGANSAIFSLFDHMILRPLPVHEPERLVNLAAPGPKPGSQSCNQAGDCEVVFSYSMFRDLEAAGRPFSSLAAHRLFSANLAYGNQTLNGEALLVSGSYFPVLGLRPALGRLLTPADDRDPGAHPVAVLGHGYWRTNLGSDPAVLERTLVVNGQPMTVVGVAPEGFEGTTLGARPDVYVPLTMRGALEPGFDDAGFENRRSYWAYVFGRLDPGVSIERAAEDVNAVYRPIVNEVEAPLQEGMTAESMERFRTKEVTLEEGRRGQSGFRGDVRTPLIMLLSITGLVLLTACANIANLLLARGAGRTQEMAIRGSLGAGRTRLLRQLLVESLLLAALGGLASLVVARWTLGLVGSIIPPEVGGLVPPQLRPSVVLFAAALTVGTGLLFGLYPALHATRADLIGVLRAGTGQPSGARAAARFRTWLVTGQIALSMALLVAAGLFIKSLVNVTRVDLGFRTENVVAFGLSPALNGYDAERSVALFDRVEEELMALPGVTGVTSAMIPILAGSNWGNDVSVEGFDSGPGVDANARFNAVGAGYFATLGIPLLAGREFTAADDAGGASVAVVNEAFAEKFGLNPREAVGKRMAVGRGGDMDIEIVGLVENANYAGVKQAVPPLYFLPWRQQSRNGFLTFYVRTGVAPAEVTRTVPRLVERLDPNLPVESLKPLEQQARENVYVDRMISTLAGAFAALATLLAAVGLYGVLAYTVAQRTREIGLRMALGAGSDRVRRMVLWQVTRMTVVGAVIGIGAALVLGRFVRSLLFGLEGHDPVVVVLTAALLAVVALAAGYVPALRASKVDPMQALRYE